MRLISKVLLGIAVIAGVFVVHTMEYNDEVNASSAYVTPQEPIKAVQSRAWRKM